MELNASQQKVFDACFNSESNIFCTGEGGTGKSWLLSRIVSEFRTNTNFKDKTVAVTASTGLAALNIGGVTLHSFAGIQIVEDNVTEMIKRARRGKSYGNWVDTDILILDEISMISATLFDNLSRVAQDLRGSTEPFGGIRVISFGDFLQLPPVSKSSGRVKRVFEGSAWKAMSIKCFTLTEVVRQTDLTFKKMLSLIRVGKCTQEVVDYMTSLSRDLVYEDSVEPVKLFPLRKFVDEYNNKRLSAINSDPHTFTAIDYGDIGILQQCIAPKRITLKTGAQVMFTRNINPLVVNGSIGTVTGFKYDNHSRSLWPVVIVVGPDGQHASVNVELCKWESISANGRTVVARRTQIPIILAWAATIHKSQGQTIPRLNIDLDGIFEHGQAYVALSRAVDSSNLQVKNFTKGKILTDPDSVEFYERLEQEIDNNDDVDGVVVNKRPPPKIYVGFAD
jgi:ATP-dependent DNA helicase PIF1